jgi:hypothetical protein
MGPADVPRGGKFGLVGPDPGWASKVVGAAKLPDESPALRSVILGLVMARAAALGRAAVPEDVEAALVACGFYEEAPANVVARRKRWIAAVAHDSRPGETAVAEMNRALLIDKPERIRWAQRMVEKKI